jgi:hypothetical protein
MPDIYGFKTAEELIAEQRDSQQRLFGQTLQDNMSRARTGREMDQIGLGNLIGTLGVKLFQKYAPQKESQAITDARQYDTSFAEALNVPTQSIQRANVATDGGIRNTEKQVTLQPWEQTAQKAMNLRGLVDNLPESLQGRSSQILAQAAALSKQAAEERQAFNAREAISGVAQSMGLPQDVQDLARIGELTPTQLVAFEANKAKVDQNILSEEGRASTASYAKSLGAPQEVQSAILTGVMELKDYTDSIKQTLTEKQKIVIKLIESSQGLMSFEEANQTADSILGNRPATATASKPSQPAPTNVVSGTDIGLGTPSPKTTPSTPERQQTVDEQVDATLNELGLTRETAPVNVIEALTNATKRTSL